MEELESSEKRDSLSEFTLAEVKIYLLFVVF